ncbi:MAG: RHS repeat-associated core domain-containing protein [Moheibacter sp.]
MKNYFYISDIYVSEAFSNQKTGGFKDGNTNPALDDYAYDLNGNMTLDRNKGITNIVYNHLNLPVEIQWNSTKKIEYLYNAAGGKVQKKVTNGTNIKTTDYLDGFQYNQQVLEFFPHAEGYVKATNFSLGGNPNYAFNYVYNYTDHLGNVRLSYAKDPQTGNLKILDESHYYPFGLKHQEYQANGFTTNPIQGVIIAPVANNPFKYKFQNQELQDEFGLNWYSFKWRNYMPDIGRFFNIDPLSDSYAYQSVYNFSENKVIAGVELEGLEFLDHTEARIVIRANGTVAYKMKNMTKITQNKFAAVNENPKNWTNGIGINTTIGSIAISGLANNDSNYGGHKKSGSEIKNITKSGRTDRRFKKRVLGMDDTGIGKSGVSAKSLSFIMAADLVVNIAASSLIWSDNKKARSNLSVLENEVSNILNLALKDGVIPSEYLNTADLISLTSVILQGEVPQGRQFDESRDPALIRFGLDIYHFYNKYQNLDDDDRKKKWDFEQIKKQIERNIKDSPKQ